MKFAILALLALVLLCGCARTDSFWDKRFVPTTEQERAAVREHELELMKCFPAAVTGHDQDFDDALREAHRVACETICKPTLWERRVDGFGGIWFDTGVWKTPAQ